MCLLNMAGYVLAVTTNIRMTCINIWGLCTLSASCCKCTIHGDKFGSIQQPLHLETKKHKQLTIKGIFNVSGVSRNRKQDNKNTSEFHPGHFWLPRPSQTARASARIPADPENTRGGNDTSREGMRSMGKLGMRAAS
jgi:hypothetical protein